MQIKISCHADDTLHVDDLTEFQGELKLRTQSDVENMSASIVKHGFAFPFFVWENEGKNYILDGHGRLQALKHLRNNGYEINLVPVVYVNADSEKTSKELLLRLNSSYGEVDYDALDALIRESGEASAGVLDEFADSSATEGEYEIQKSTWEPVLNPMFDARTITGEQILEAERNTLRPIGLRDMVETTCKTCGAKTFIYRHTLERFVEGKVT
jgi:ParB-like chromosome segregation protein Spo0J